ncbi:hypothetical protein [Pseudomonas sp. EMN2]|uniref:hypothetical protein n=1 Tax=Pseudomonas sp. EMN2 TaxID=2615212 RepID=UPI00129B0E4F|nr:hypothetical protein [Pseudomonas sp. EMN2]
MNRWKQHTLTACALGLLAGCVQQRYEPIVNTEAHTPVQVERWTFQPVEIKYVETQSPAWNFQQVLEQNAWKCGQEASMGYILYRQLRGYGSSKRPDDRAQALADCQQYAYQRGNEAIARLKQAKVPTQAMNLSKDLYAKWSVYMAGMSISAPKGSLVANQYEVSRRALLAEDKFTK